jgi:hypothetical protein
MALEEAESMFKDQTRFKWSKKWMLEMVQDNQEPQPKVATFSAVRLEEVEFTTPSPERN